MRGYVYTLPEITFIGGTTIPCYFNCYKDGSHGKIPINLDGCTANFSIVDYANRNGNTLLDKQAEIVMGNDGELNTIFVNLEPEDTVDLHNKFIYQISIIDDLRNVRIPNQGILFIVKNNNPEFIKGRI